VSPRGHEEREAWASIQARCLRFQLVPVPAEPGNALTFLRNAREHLEPGGLLGIEVSSAFSSEELAEGGGCPDLCHDLTRELTQGTLERFSFSISRYDAAS
jgi:hypothetical protein